MLIHDACDEAQLLRLALAVHDEGLADQAFAAAQQRLDVNPGVPSIAATVAHCRGLVSNGQAELARAVELFAASPRPLAHASALEDLALSLIDGGERPAAVDRLDESHALTRGRARRGTRHVDTKLGINSRAELARVALAQAIPDG
jgi:hypothetical protein